MDGYFGMYYNCVEVQNSLIMNIPQLCGINPFSCRAMNGYSDDNHATDDFSMLAIYVKRTIHD
jgi:hypothetical protein